MSTCFSLGIDDSDDTEGNLTQSNEKHDSMHHPVPAVVPIHVPAEVPRPVSTVVTTHGLAEVPSPVPTVVPTHGPAEVPRPVSTVVPTHGPAEVPRPVPAVTPFRLPTYDKDDYVLPDSDFYDVVSKLQMK